MSKQKYPEEFKIEAVKQITERGHKVADVSARLCVSQHSLYQWIKRYTLPVGQRQAQTSQTDELRRIKATDASPPSAKIRQSSARRASATCGPRWRRVRTAAKHLGFPPVGILVLSANQFDAHE